MRHTPFFGYLAVTAMLTLTLGLCEWATAEMVSGGDTPGSDADTLASMRAEVAELRQANQSLRQAVGQLQSDMGETWLNERRAEEVKTLVREVLADADTRASLLEGGMTAGHNGKNFFLASEDGSFLLKIKGQIQFRYVANWRDEPATAGNSIDNSETGFVVRRAKIQFSGHISSPKLTYALQLSVNRDDNSAIADKIVIGYAFNENWSIWFGEDKAPFLREELTSSSKQLAVERSYVNEVFTVDKAQGVALTYKSERIRVTAMINDGMRSGDGSSSVNPFTQLDDFDAQNDPDGGGPLTGDRSTSKDFYEDATDFALTARVDILVTGGWHQMADFTAWDGEEMAVFVGAAIHWEEGESGDRFNNNDFFMWTFDGSVEYQRFNLFLAVMGMHTDVTGLNAAGTGPAKSYDMLGFVVQAGYQIPFRGEVIEPFIRYEWVDFEDAIISSGTNVDDEIAIITFGFNWYFNKHAAKFTADVMYALDPVPLSSSGLGLLSDVRDQDEQLVLRGQFQLLF